MAETAISGTAPASAMAPPIRRPGPSSRGSTEASPSARVGGTREARRPAPSTASSAAITQPPIAAATGSPSACDDEVRRGDPVVHEPFAQRVAEDGSRDDPCGGAEETDEDRLPRDHAADLARRGGDRAQQRDLPLALLDREAHRAGHDEHGDEQRDPSEGRGDGDQLGARLLQFGVLGLAAGAAGEDRGAVARGAKARGVKAGRGEDADRVGLPRMAGQTRSLGVGEEHRTLLGDGVAWMCDADDGDRAALSV